MFCLSKKNDDIADESISRRLTRQSTGHAHPPIFLRVGFFFGRRCPFFVVAAAAAAAAAVVVVVVGVVVVVAGRAAPYFDVDFFLRPFHKTSRSGRSSP